MIAEYIKSDGDKATRGDGREDVGDAGDVDVADRGIGGAHGGAERENSGAAGLE